MKYLGYLILFLLSVFIFSCKQKSNEFKVNSDYHVTRIKKNLIANDPFKVFVMDTITQVKNKASQIEFIEISKFSDNLSIRYLTKNQRAYHHFYKSKSGDTAHYFTTYMVLSSQEKLGDNRLEKLFSLLEYELLKNKKDSGLGDYFLINTTVNQIHYFKTDKDFNKSTPVYNGKVEESYAFDTDNSSYSAKIFNYLLRNFEPQKFHKLWQGNFSHFK